MHQEDVARFCLGVGGGESTVRVGLGSRPTSITRDHVQPASVRGNRQSRPRPHLELLNHATTVRVLYRQPHLVGRPGPEKKDTAGQHVVATVSLCRVVVTVVVDSQQVHRFGPLRTSRPPVLDPTGRIVISIALDVPLDADRVECRITTKRPHSGRGLASRKHRRHPESRDHNQQRKMTAEGGVGHGTDPDAAEER